MIKQFLNFGKYWRFFYGNYLLRRTDLFDRNWYLAKNPDVAQANLDPYLHYLRYGAYEGRDPSPVFNQQRYPHVFEQAKNRNINPVIYYLKYRKKDNLHLDYGEPRFFCISMQRTGTTSVGKFFRDFGFRWAGWEADLKNNWSGDWHEGAYENIFNSPDFINANAFEDSPWFLPDFYKILYNRFPNAKFILFTRDPEAWFRSMVSHSGGNIIGGARGHCKVYRRELEYYDLLHSGKINEEIENSPSIEKEMKIIGHADHYKEVYRLHSIEVKDFFRRHKPEALFVGELEDTEKWIKLGEFLGVDVPTDYTSHENATNKTMA